MPKPKRPNMTLREQEDAAVVFRRRLHQFTGLAAVCA
ncbi:hypothetical protein STW0522PSE72_P30530 (plasmid) [Pseudomonas monteilii]|nr:hypothetical protein STW0522PSE72_P30530 [Pseudomonas monteilii]